MTQVKYRSTGTVSRSLSRQSWPHTERYLLQMGAVAFLQKKAPTYRMKHVQSETFNLDIFLLALVKYCFCNITQIRN